MRWQHRVIEYLRIVYNILYQPKNNLTLFAIVCN